MEKLVGAGHVSALSKLWEAYRHTTSDQMVRMVVLEGPTGFGKTRVVHEFYKQLAASQSHPRYWPPSLSQETESSDGWMKVRKRPYPNRFEIPSNAELEWFWWGLICSKQADGEHTQALWAGKSQFRAHLRHFGKSKSARSLTEEALDVGGLAVDILNILQVVIPGAGVLTGTNAVKNLYVRAKELTIRRRTRHSHRQEKLTGRLIEGRDTERTVELSEMATSTLQASKKIPIVIYVEDAHWADETLCEFIERVMSGRNGRVLVIATVWPESDINIKRKSFRTLLQPGHDWVEESRLQILNLAEMTSSEMQELIEGEFARFNPTGEGPDPSITQAILERYGSRPLSVKSLFALERIQRLVKSGQLSEFDIQRCPADLESLLDEYFGQTPTTVQQLMSLASVAGIEFNQAPVLGASEDLKISNAANSLSQSNQPYGLIEIEDSDSAEFADPALHQIAERKSEDFFGPDERRVIVRRMVSFADSLDVSVATVETCRIAWSIHVSLAEKKLTATSGAVRSAKNLSRLYSSRYNYEQSRRCMHRAVEWTPEEQRAGDQYEELLTQLADLEYVMGAVQTALNLYSELSASVKGVSPTDGARILHFRHMRGVCLKKLGRLDEAITELSRVEMERRALGSSLSQGALNSKHHVIVCHRLAGRAALAEQQGRELLSEQIKLLGTNHEDCFATEIEIGRCILVRADFSAASAWFEGLYRRAEIALGNHPYRWTILGERSETLAKLSQLPLAVELGEDALAGMTSLLGGRHPSTLGQKKKVAVILAELGQLPRATSMLRQVLVAEEFEYGDDDSRVNSTRSTLAMITQRRN